MVLAGAGQARAWQQRPRVALRVVRLAAAVHLLAGLRVGGSVA
jgi:hypothetical protein